MARRTADQTVHREDILVAAASVFQERGYEGATMADIAARVKLTAGTLYHHFPAGKRDLLLAVLNEGMTIILLRAEEIEAQKLPPADTLRELIRVHIVGVTENVAVGAAMVFEIHALLDLEQEAAERDAFLHRRDQFERYFRRAIERGIKGEVFRPVDVGIFTKTLLGAQNWVSVWYHPGGRLNGEQIADRIADTFLASLRSQA